MDDQELSRLLNALPRTDASSGFTERVIAKLDAPRTGRGPRPVLRWVVAAAGVTALVAASFSIRDAVRERDEQRQAAARLESMRDEYRALELELEKLRSLAAEAEPVLDLGGTEQVDFVLDLTRLAEEQGRARARQTSHTPR